MVTKLDGIKLANKINENTKKEIMKFESVPHLVAIKVGKNPESELYLGHKSKKAKEVGLKFTLLTFEEDVEMQFLITEIDKLNRDTSVDGIMIQLPLPKHIDSISISQSIEPIKDVEGFHPLNKGLLDIDRAELISPTAQGVIELIEEYNINIKSELVVVVGLGEIAGKPLAKLFINRGATVIMCNKKTKDVCALTRQAHIVVSAVGYKHLINSFGIKDNAVVINVGLTKDEDGLHGDVETETISEKASFISPTVGGTGPMTVALLMRNTLVCKKLNK